MDDLILEVMRDLTARRDNKEVVASATRFMIACCESEKHTPSSTLPQIVEWGLNIEDAALYKAAVRAGFGQEQLARLVNEEYAKHAPESKRFGDKEWETWYANVFFFHVLSLRWPLTGRLGLVLLPKSSSPSRGCNWCCATLLSISGISISMRGSTSTAGKRQPWAGCS